MKPKRVVQQKETSVEDAVAFLVDIDDYIIDIQARLIRCLKSPKDPFSEEAADEAACIAGFEESLVRVREMRRNTETVIAGQSGGIITEEAKNRQRRRIFQGNAFYDSRYY